MNDSPVQALSTENSEFTRKPLITAKDLGVRRGERQILSNVSLKVHKGEIVTVIGPNGAGKTTLVRVLLGLEKLDRGRVNRLGGLDIGYMPQRFAVDRAIPLTVSRFITLGRRAPVARIREVLGEVGAAYLEKTQISDLSGGELQRVLLARALIGEPQLLVLDEPVQGVDFAGEAALYRLIGDLRDKRGCGILLVSHDLHFVLAASDRVICLNGHVCCSGVPEAVARDPEYVQLFGSEAAARAFAVYHHEHDHAHDLSGEISCKDHDGGKDKGRL